MEKGIKEKTEKKTVNRLTASLARYVSRMSTRCTPFGLFASCGIGEIGNRTSIILKDHFKRTTRLDMLCIYSIYEYISKLPDFKRKIKYYPNSSIYKIGNKFRYIEFSYENTKRVYNIAEVKYTHYLNKILQSSLDGQSIDTLIYDLMKENISEEESRNYIEELITSQLLVGELFQVITGDDYYTSIIDLLKNLEINNKVYAHLECIFQHLKMIDESHDSGLNKYSMIKSSINEILPSFEEKYLFQVDTNKALLESVIGNEIIDELELLLTFLNKINDIYENINLKHFKEAFYNKYENQEIPLMEALDPETGIGYPYNRNQGDISPLINDFSTPIDNKIEQELNLSLFHIKLLNKIIDCLNKGYNEIVLTDDDVKGVDENWNDLPSTFAVMFSILKAKKSNILISLNSCGGSSAANLIGRFAHTDKEIFKLVKDITDKEQNLEPNKILAEIVHFPDARVGNILFRPHIRDYEIIYMATSTLPKDKYIYPSDILLSIRQGYFVLRSKRLNKEIIPYLTNAHNYKNSPLPFYRFMCDIQTQGKRPGLSFGFGGLENHLNFIPRVRYRNTILARATWKINKDDMNFLFLIINQDKLIMEISKWRKQYKLPRCVLFIDGDNELFVDWESSICIQSLFSIIMNKRSLTFAEFLSNEEDAIVRDINGDAFVNECIVAFYKDK